MRRFVSSAIIFLIGFLRGQPINLGTQSEPILSSRYQSPPSRSHLPHHNHAVTYLTFYTTIPFSQLPFSGMAKRLPTTDDGRAGEVARLMQGFASGLAFLYTRGMVQWIKLFRACLAFSFTVGLGWLIAYSNVLAGEAAPAATASPTVAGPWHDEGVATGDWDQVRRTLYATAQSSAVHPAAAELAMRLAASIPDRRLVEPYPSSLDAQMKALSIRAKALPAQLDLVRAVLAKHKRARGDLSGALRIQQTRGIIPVWRVMGSFGYYGEVDFNVPYPPETSPALAPTFSTVAGLVAWQTLREGNALPVMQPWERIYPRRGIVYAVAEANAPRPVSGWLDIRTSSSFKVFLNGRLVGVGNRLEHSFPFQNSLPVTFLKGWNRLMLKLLRQGTQPGITVRLLDRDGQPTQGLTWNHFTPQNATRTNLFHPLQRGADQPPAALVPPAYLRALRTAALRQPTKARLNASLAAAYREAQCHDDALYYARLAARAALANPWIQYLLAACEREASHLSLTGRRNRERRALERVLATRQDFVPALLRLAELDMRQRQYASALRYCQRALTVQPRSLTGLVLRCRLALDQAWTEEGDRWVKELRQHFPNAPASLRVRARWAARNTHPAVAAELYRRRYQRRPADWRTGLAAARAFAVLGKRVAVSELIKSVLLQAPRNPNALRQSGNITRSLGDWSGALGQYRRAKTLLPTRALLDQRIGDMLYRQGNFSAAVGAYRDSVLRDPGQHALRRLVNTLATKRPPFWDAYALSSEAQLRALAARKKTLPGSSVRVIDQTILQIYPDGSYANYTHRLQKIQSSSKRIRQRIGAVRVAGETLAVRTILSDGTSREPLLLPGQETFTMPHLSWGGAVEHIFLETAPTRRDRRLVFPHWYFRSLAQAEPFAWSEYVVIVPKGFPFSFAARNLTSRHYRIRFRTYKKMASTVYAWRGRNMPRAFQEPGAADVEEWLPYVQIGDKQTWQQVNHRLMRSYVGRVTVTRDIQALADQLTANAVSLREKIARLYTFVERKIDTRRSRAPASTILEMRSGNRLLLLYALLRAAGFSPKYVAVRPHHDFRHEPNWQLPEAYYFTHRLLAVDLPKGERIWLDMRYRYLRAGEILADLSRATAFIVGDGQGIFATLPAVQSATERVHETRTVTIAEQAKAFSCAGEWQVGGTNGAFTKERFATLSSDQRRDRIETQLAKSLPGVVIQSLALPAMTEAGQPFRATYSATLSGLENASPDGIMRLPLFLTPLNLLPPNLHEKRLRRTPWHLRHHRLGDDSVTLKLPPGAQVLHLPDTAIFRTPFGVYQLTITTKKRRIQITRSYAFSPQRVSPAAWPQLQELHQRIADLEREQIRIQLNPAASPPILRQAHDITP